MLCVVFTIYLIKAGGYKGTTLTRVLLYGIVRIIVATVVARIVGYYYVRSLEKKLEINREIIIKTNLKKKRQIRSFTFTRILKGCLNSITLKMMKYSINLLTISKNS
jgi:hypothetical protein